MGVILISDWIVSKGFYIESTDVSKLPATFIKIHLNEKMRARSKKELFLDTHFNTLTSVAKCRGSWVEGRGRGSWVWVNVVGKKKV